jgi:hypothetical protein
MNKPKNRNLLEADRKKTLDELRGEMDYIRRKTESREWDDPDGVWGAVMGAFSDSAAACLDSYYRQIDPAVPKSRRADSLRVFGDALLGELGGLWAEYSHLIPKNANWGWSLLEGDIQQHMKRACEAFGGEAPQQFIPRYPAFAGNLKRLIKERGYSWDQLVNRLETAKIGVKRDSIIDYRCGRTIPHPDNRTAIAEILSVTVDELLGEPRVG